MKSLLIFLDLILLLVSRFHFDLQMLWHLWNLQSLQFFWNYLHHFLDFVNYLLQIFKLLTLLVQIDSKQKDLLIKNLYNLLYFKYSFAWLYWSKLTVCFWNSLEFVRLIHLVYFHFRSFLDVYFCFLNLTTRLSLFVILQYQSLIHQLRLLHN